MTDFELKECFAESVLSHSKEFEDIEIGLAEEVNGDAVSVAVYLKSELALFKQGKIPDVGLSYLVATGRDLRMNPTKEAISEIAKAKLKNTRAVLLRNEVELANV